MSDIWLESPCTDDNELEIPEEVVEVQAEESFLDTSYSAGVRIDYNSMMEER